MYGGGTTREPPTHREIATPHPHSVHPHSSGIQTLWTHFQSHSYTEVLLRMNFKQNFQSINEKMDTFSYIKLILFPQEKIT